MSQEQPATGSWVAQAPIKPDITYEEFDKIDLRVATILEASPFPDTDKLMLLKVDLGFEQRQIVAGVKQHYTPETLIGKQIIVVANLAARKMRGIESQGMLLAASFIDVSKYDSPALVLATTATTVPPGVALH